MSNDTYQNNNTGMGSKSHFWVPSEPNAENDNACRYPHAENCGLGQDNPELCDLHKAKDMTTISEDSIKLIEAPTFASPDDAAMAAANIILYHVSQDANVEYGISIYGNEENNVFCLAETRRGDGGEVFSDYKIIPPTNSEYAKYSFKADVHSHPIPNPNIQEFSVADYILACGGHNLSRYLDSFPRPPHLKYLVGVENINEWSRGLDYGMGAIVRHNGGFCSAIKSNRSEEPQTMDGAWKAVKTWNPNDTYKKDAIVYHPISEHPIGGHFWRAVKSNKDNKPGTYTWTLARVDAWKKSKVDMVEEHNYYETGDVVFYSGYLWQTYQRTNKNVRPNKLLWRFLHKVNDWSDKHSEYEKGAIVRHNNEFWKATKKHESNKHNSPTPPWVLYVRGNATLTRFIPPHTLSKTLGKTEYRDIVFDRNVAKSLAIILAARYLHNQPNNDWANKWGYLDKNAILRWKALIMDLKSYSKFGDIDKGWETKVASINDPQPQQYRRSIDFVTWDHILDYIRYAYPSLNIKETVYTIISGNGGQLHRTAITNEEKRSTKIVWEDLLRK